MRAVEALGGPGATAREVADSKGLDVTEVSNALRRAWERYYLKRRGVRDDWNQTVWLYALTVRGAKYLDACDQEHEDWT